MAWILNIDTAVDKASVCLGRDGVCVAYAENDVPTQQAAWLHPAIERAMREAGVEWGVIEAIAVSNGPGSYTGLRIGLATAKGFCYALGKKLICLNTLQVMASAVLPTDADLICPMIDARRMEVYTALYDREMQEVLPPQAMVLTKESFADFLRHRSIVCTGNGAEKFGGIMSDSGNLLFKPSNINACNMLKFSEKAFSANNFSDIAYSEPFYLKDIFIKSV
ncbi:MAG: tRNA (adenosine(37)-N6)-threonylcarbamoyltransferase complex dimerization subunit type 1 TsaB [Niabella sp.]